MIKEVMFLYGIGWIQRFGSCQIYKRKRVSAFIIEETVIQVGNQHFWLWICIEPIDKSLLGIYISEERNMLVAEKFIRSLGSKYGKHTYCIYRWRYFVQKNVMSWDWNTIYILLLRRVWWKELTNILRIKLRDLMTPTIHVRKMIAIYFMYITGYNSLFLCIMIQHLRIILSNIWLKEVNIS